MKDQKLNQVIAAEKAQKNQLNAEINSLYQSAQKPTLFEGLQRNYKPLTDDGKVLPPESTRVQLKAKDVVRNIANKMTELFDITATKDFANCNARANIVVDDKILVANVPATHLLFLEKGLADFHTMVGALPELDPSQTWTFDNNDELYKTADAQTHRTEKIQRPLVLYPATDKHPAQTQLVTEDVLVGYWHTVRVSGAVPAAWKYVTLSRIEKLQKAVKFAREEANGSPAPDVQVGDAIFGWLLE